MKSEFTAIIETAPEGGYWAICPEVPGANVQGETINEAKENLRQAIELIRTVLVHMTIEHAGKTAHLPDISFQQIGNTVVA